MVKPIKQPQKAPNAAKININSDKRGSAANIGDRRNSFNNNEIKGTPNVKHEMEIEEPRNRIARFDSEKNKNIGVRKQ